MCKHPTFGLKETIYLLMLYRSPLQKSTDKIEKSNYKFMLIGLPNPYLMLQHGPHLKTTTIFQRDKNKNKNKKVKETTLITRNISITPQASIKPISIQESIDLYKQYMVSLKLAAIQKIYRISNERKLDANKNFDRV